MICGHLEQDFFFFISMLFTLYIYMLIIQASDFIVWPQRKYVSILVGCNFLFNIIKCGFVIILRYLVLTSLNLTFSKCDDSPLNMNYFLFSFFSSHIVSFILMPLFSICSEEVNTDDGICLGSGQLLLTDRLKNGLFFYRSCFGVQIYKTLFKVVHMNL